MPDQGIPRTGLVAVGRDGQVIAPGSVVTTGGGASYTYLYATRATEEGGSLGKVVVSDGYDGDTLQRREFELFAHIFGITVRAEDPGPPAAGHEPHPWFGRPA